MSSASTADGAGSDDLQGQSALYPMERHLLATLRDAPADAGAMLSDESRRSRGWPNVT